MTRDEEFLDLVNRYLDGTATADEVARLDQHLCQDSAARQTYAELLNLDSALAALASDMPAKDSRSCAAEK